MTLIKKKKGSQTSKQWGPFDREWLYTCKSKVLCILELCNNRFKNEIQIKAHSPKALKPEINRLIIFFMNGQFVSQKHKMQLLSTIEIPLTTTFRITVYFLTFLSLFFWRVEERGFVLSTRTCMNIIKRNQYNFR